MTTSNNVENNLNDKNTTTISAKRKKLRKRAKRVKFNNYLSNMNKEKDKKTARDILISTGQLKESVEAEAAKYFWALRQLDYNADFNHVVEILNRSKSESVDGTLMIGLVAAESSFIPNATHFNSGSNDFGLFQLNNLWHNQFKGSITKHIEEGISHFKWCLKTEKGNQQRALSRYNTGGSDNSAGRTYASYVMRKKKAITDKAKKYREATRNQQR